MFLYGKFMNFTFILQNKQYLENQNTIKITISSYAQKRYISWSGPNFAKQYVQTHKTSAWKAAPV